MIAYRFASFVRVLLSLVPAWIGILPAAAHGEVLIGLRAQHRVQTHGTFKLVFNALVERAE